MMGESQVLRAVSIHAPAGGATNIAIMCRGIRCVSIHAPAGGATWQKFRFFSGYQFQSTRPRGARPPDAKLCFRYAWFQSTRPRGARHREGLYAALDVVFQSTRPRGARPAAFCREYCAWCVSIHAPAGGATQQQNRFCQKMTVSIHAPAGGATQKPGLLTLFTTFQSTRPRGARHNHLTHHRHHRHVSIHAPAGGATELGQSSAAGILCFNPRARGGRDAYQAKSHYRGDPFQSTRPRGARPSAPSCGNHCWKVSIHAPAGGATPRLTSCKAS